MYATCLFCGGPLGRNEVIEHFPVGRRLAYDPAKGRLWVVCRKCERWNLTPLETRWEAIEHAERQFRETKLRVATDNIALAQLREGLELVRIGAPPKLEFAAWRYGDQFGRRRRRHLAVTGVTVGAGAAVIFGQLAQIWMPSAALFFATLAMQVSDFARGSVSRRRDAKRFLFVRPSDTDAIELTRLNLRMAAFVPAGPDGWSLKVPIGNWHVVDRNSLKHDFERTIILQGAPALLTLSRMLPYLNRDGGGAKRVRQAVDVVNEARDLNALVRSAATNDETRKKYFKLKDGEINVAILPARLRLALEMALHERDEQRAMNGELAELEERWREAEVIAGIADSLTLSAEVEQKLRELRTRNPRGAPPHP